MSTQYENRLEKERLEAAAVADAAQAAIEAGDTPPPRDWEREMLLLLLAFNRFAPADIAHAFGKDPAELEAMCSDPEVIRTRRALTRMLPGEQDIETVLLDDAEANFRWLRNLRRGYVDGKKLDSLDPKILRERRAAAQFLGERQIAKKVPAVDITVSRGRGRNDDAAIDVTPADEKRIASVMRMLEAPAKVKEPANG